MSDLGDGLMNQRCARSVGFGSAGENMTANSPTTLASGAESFAPEPIWSKEELPENVFDRRLKAGRATSRQTLGLRGIAEAHCSRGREH